MSRCYCHKCRMSFEVREPGPQAERMRCADCKRPFSCGADPATNVAKPCVSPAHAHMYSDAEPEMHRNRVLP